MRQVIDIYFQVNTEQDKSILSTLSNNDDLKQNVHCVYIYSLADNEIKYPVRNGKVIYIGEAWRQNEPTGKRFSGHITKAKDEGNNFTTNRAISSYYYENYRIRLQIYCLDNVQSESERKTQEKKLYTLHAKEYGAKPIGQGVTGEGYTPKALDKVNGNEVEYGAIKP